MKGIFRVIGISHVRRDGQAKSFDILHCVGDFDRNFGNHEGDTVCTSYVDCDRYHVGDCVTIFAHKGDYIVLD